MDCISFPEMQGIVNEFFHSYVKKKIMFKEACPRDR